MSGKWPEDLQAVRRLKAAFHVQLSEALSAEHNLISCAYPDHVLVLKVGHMTISMVTLSSGMSPLKVRVPTFVEVIGKWHFLEIQGNFCKPQGNLDFFDGIQR